MGQIPRNSGTGFEDERGFVDIRNFHLDSSGTFVSTQALLSLNFIICKKGMGHSLGIEGLSRRGFRSQNKGKFSRCFFSPFLLGI